MYYTYVCMKVPQKYAIVNFRGHPSRLASQIIADGRIRLDSTLQSTDLDTEKSLPSRDPVFPSIRTTSKVELTSRECVIGRSLNGVAFLPSETDASRTSARPFIPLNATFTCIMSPP